MVWYDSEYMLICVVKRCVFVVGWREYMSDEQLLEAVLELHGGNDEDAVNLQLDVLTIDNKLRRADQASR